MKRGKTYDWIPLWIDKWIFGSTRIELEPAERSVWTDFMALAAKDDGFIRANEKTGYLPRQLAGMLCISEKLLQSSIEKFLKFGKIRDEGNTIYRLVNWEEYSLSERHKRRVMSEKSDIASGSADACISLSLMSKSQSLSLKKGGGGGRFILTVHPGMKLRMRIGRLGLRHIQPVISKPNFGRWLNG